MLTADRAHHTDAARLGFLINESAKRATELGRSLPLDDVLRLAQLEAEELVGQRVHGLHVTAEPQASAFVCAIRRAAAARQRVALPKGGKAR